MIQLSYEFTEEYHGVFVQKVLQMEEMLPKFIQ